ncbi:hypothetical protein [Pseudomonas gessardii]|uniref:CDI toxin immunity protein n=1 Tax=Pseudomonas gessardii TaxID=78544 RepID=UPI0018D5D5DB|nr:hypothetical protein [Pseudomonas gessardii]MBH3425790.1 hypothetical protein [Pseudomonas gessardii]
MTLFEECKEALGADFNVLEGKACQDVIDILHGFPFAQGDVIWSEVNSSEYESIDALLDSNPIGNKDVFVFADDVGIPIFRTRLSLICENVYDVIALSPKLFIFNDEVILKPLFPIGMFRLGIKSDAS